MHISRKGERKKDRNMNIYEPEKEKNGIKLMELGKRKQAICVIVIILFKERNKIKARGDETNKYHAYSRGYERGE